MSRDAVLTIRSRVPGTVASRVPAAAEAAAVGSACGGLVFTRRAYQIERSFQSCATFLFLDRAFVLVRYCGVSVFSVRCSRTGASRESRMSRQAVTVIGLGPMGRAMVDAFLDRGHAVTVWNRTASKAEELVARGAVLAP